jgi:hypothetical protein
LTADASRPLDVLLQDGCSAAEFLQVVALRSSATADAAWETLSVIDQLYRRGKLSEELFHQAKSRIERRVLGIQEPAQSPQRAPAKLVLAAPPAAKFTSSLAPAAVAITTPVNSPAPAAAPTPPPAATAAELATLREQVQAARLQAAVYRERLEAIEGRRSASAYPADEESPRAQLRQGNGPWRKASAAAPRLALLAVLVGAGALFLSSHRLSRPPRTALAPPPAVQTIAVAASAPPAIPGELSLSADRYLVAPGAARAIIGVKRSGGTSGAVTVEYWTANLGAKAGRDYLGPGRATLTIPEGMDQAQIQVPILANPRRRHTEMFEVRIARPGGGATLGQLARATVFILPP